MMAFPDRSVTKTADATILQAELSYGARVIVYTARLADRIDVADDAYGSMPVDLCQ